MKPIPVGPLGVIPSQMSDECPNCGAPYSDRVTVEMGDSYSDVFGRTPRSLISQYVRICPDPKAAKVASRNPHQDVDVYVHRFEDLDRSTGFSD